MPDYLVSLKELPSGEQPRERLRDLGPAALSDAEVLAIVLRTGVAGLDVVRLARKLLLDYGGWPGLQRASFADLRAFRGLGDAKIAQIKAALDIGRRLLLAAPDQRLQISAASDVAALLQLEMAHLEQEHLRAVILNTRGELLKIATVTVGSVNSASLRIAELFREPIKLNATSLIVVHNHPSGDPTPSPDDILLTRQIIQAGQLLDIEVLDHLIIGQGRWISLRERRLGWSA
ncbi:MAG TPA: DNA repair protein RadC [Herpetosiphonaceae bacterium]